MTWRAYRAQRPAPLDRVERVLLFVDWWLWHRREGERDGR